MAGKRLTLLVPHCATLPEIDTYEEETPRIGSASSSVFV